MTWTVTLCPACGGPSGVVDTRTRKSDGAVRRRRKCRKCRRRWTTVEMLAEESRPSRKVLGRALGNARAVERLLSGMLDGVQE